MDKGDLSPDGVVVLDDRLVSSLVASGLSLPVDCIHSSKLQQQHQTISKENKTPFFIFYDSVMSYQSSVSDLSAKQTVHKTKANFILVTAHTIEALKEVLLSDPTQPVVIILKPLGQHPCQEVRNLIFWLHDQGIIHPVFLLLSSPEVDDEEKRKLHLALQAGPLLLDGLLDGLWVQEQLPSDVKTAFNILQASRARISKPEYISCPSCGRTLFDIQEVTAKIKAETAHLKGVKIGIMGCIVNGPGEMADADFGYVGVGTGKINLYRKKEIVERQVPSDQAVERLVELIKKNGMWREKNPAPS